MEEVLNVLINHLSHTGGWCSSMSLGERRLQAAELGVSMGKIQKLSGPKITFYALPGSGRTHDDCLALFERGEIR